MNAPFVFAIGQAKKKSCRSTLHAMAACGYDAYLLLSLLAIVGVEVLETRQSFGQTRIVLCTWRRSLRLKLNFTAATAEGGWTQRNV